MKVTNFISEVLPSCAYTLREFTAPYVNKRKKKLGEINVFITEISVKAGTQWREYNVKKKFIKDRRGKP